MLKEDYILLLGHNFIKYYIYLNWNTNYLLI